MIEVNQYLLPEIVPQNELQAWRTSLKKVQAENCPEEVKQFIDAVAEQLPDFGRIRNESVRITGYELRLAGMKEYNGEFIHDTFLYELPVPYMVAVDHHTSMHRIFKRKGKQGLIDYCKAHVNNDHLERLLKVLNVHVFHQESEEFKRVMSKIMATKKAA